LFFNPVESVQSNQAIERRLQMALPTRVSRGQRVSDPFEMAQREFDTALNRFFGGREMSSDGGGWAPYAVDVREDSDHIYVEADLPGFQKNEIDVTLENQTLTISAVHSQESENQNGGKGEYLLRERRYNRFLRSFTLPPTVNDQKVQAKLNDGILTITLDKREETKPRKVQIG
jgi:HSP20 family protein